MSAGPPLENKNAEIWDIETSQKLFNDTKEMSKDDQYDFIGEIARDLGISRHTYTYLVTKYPQLESDLNIILGNLEANCFKHSKTGKIKEASAIMNLKSNYRWTDRNDHTSGDKPIESSPQINLTIDGEKIKLK